MAFGSIFGGFNAFHMHTIPLSLDNGVNGALTGKRLQARLINQATGWVAPRMRRVSSGVENRLWRLEEDVADVNEQLPGRASAGQVQLDAVLVLDDAHGDLEQLQNDRERLGPRQFGVGQHFGPQRVVEHMRRAREE